MIPKTLRLEVGGSEIAKEIQKHLNSQTAGCIMIGGEGSLVSAVDFEAGRGYAVVVGPEGMKAMSRSGDWCCPTLHDDTILVSTAPSV